MEIRVRDALRKFVVPFMKPAEDAWLFSWNETGWKTSREKDGNHWSRGLLGRIQNVPYELQTNRSDGSDKDLEGQRVVVFARVLTMKPRRYGILPESVINTGHWVCIYAGPVLARPRAFRMKMESVAEWKGLEEARHFVIVWGMQEYADRDVCEVFSTRWIVYDRYGSLFEGKENPRRRNSMPFNRSTQFAPARLSCEPCGAAAPPAADAVTEMQLIGC